MTFEELCWRLQHIAEEEVGTRVRKMQQAEDAAFAQAMRNIEPH